jgi:RNA recognition motif-containing protein
MRVGNLSPDVTEGEVEDLFVQYGEIIDFYLPSNGEHNRGFAFITMPADEAKRAYDALNGTKLLDRTLRIRQSQSRQGELNCTRCCCQFRCNITLVSSVAIRDFLLRIFGEKRRRQRSASGQ